MTKARQIEAVDLFCGVGGLTHGVMRAGIKVIAGLDLDQTCKYAYETNNHAQFILSDIGKYDSNKIISLYSPDSIKVLMGCAPCQPFSKLQKTDIDKTTDSKWGLLYAFLEHIRNIKPDIISMENVPELEKEQVFVDFKTGIEILGYYIDYKVVDGSEYGVPQRRKRLLFLASKISPIKLLQPTHKDNKVTVRDVIGNLPRIDAGQTHLEDSLHRSSELSKLNLERIRNSYPGGTWRDWPKELLLECYKKDSGKSFASVYGRMKWDDLAPTLTTQFNRYGTGRYGHPEQDRAISLREGAMIQTFPFDYKFTKDDQYCMGDIARQIGNAVPVRLGEIVGLSILESLRGNI